MNCRRPFLWALILVTLLTLLSAEIENWQLRFPVKAQARHGRFRIEPLATAPPEPYLFNITPIIPRDEVKATGAIDVHHYIAAFDLFHDEVKSSARLLLPTKKDDSPFSNNTDWFNSFSGEVEKLPKPSGLKRLPSRLLPSKGAHLKDYADTLEHALDQVGYTEKCYHPYSGGFILVNRLEAIDNNGHPMEGPNRWIGTPNAWRELPFTEYVRRLFSAPVGRYRIIAFVVTSETHFDFGNEPTKDEADGWVLGSGLRDYALPKVVGERVCNDGTNCYALIYEFLVNGNGTSEPAGDKALSGVKHLVATKLFSFQEGE